MNTKHAVLIALLACAAPSCSGKIVADGSQSFPRDDADGGGGAGGAETGGTAGATDASTGGSSAGGGAGAGPAGCYARSTDVSPCQWLQSGGAQDIVLATGLHYPRGLWVQGCKVYVLEAGGWTGSPEAHDRLVELDLATKEQRVLVDHPQGGHSVAMGGDGLLYLASPTGQIPGDQGVLTVVDPSTCVESVVRELDVAAEDLFADEGGDLLIAGSTFSLGGRNIQLLRSGHFDVPQVLASDLGRCGGVTRDKALNVFFSCNRDLYQIRPNQEATMIAPAFGDVAAISLSATRMYFADFMAGTVGWRALDGVDGEVLAAGLTVPLAMSYSSPLNAAFFTETGTASESHQNGVLRVLANVE